METFIIPAGSLNADSEIEINLTIIKENKMESICHGDNIIYQHLTTEGSQYKDHKSNLQGIHFIVDNKITRNEPMFRSFPDTGLLLVNMENIVIADYSMLEIEVLSKYYPRFLKVNLFFLLKLQFKTWVKH